MNGLAAQGCAVGPPVCGRLLQFRCYGRRCFPFFAQAVGMLANSSQQGKENMGL